MTGQQDPGRQALAHQRIDAVRPPDREQVDHAAAAHEDRVLIQQRIPQRHRMVGQAEERDHARLCAALRDRTAEARDLVLGVAAGRRQQADARPPSTGLLDQQVGDRLISTPAVEVVPAAGEDPSRCAHPGLGGRAREVGRHSRRHRAVQVARREPGLDNQRPEPLQAISACLGPGGDHPASSVPTNRSAAPSSAA